MSSVRHTERMRMLFLVMSLLYWSQTEGSCSGTIVSITGNDLVLSAGEGFNLSCEFTCLTAQHVAQLWKRSSRRDGAEEENVSLVNITSILPDVILVLSISPATEADAGDYYCMTQPPDTISPEVSIQIADNLNNLTTPILTTSSIPQCDSTKQHSHAAGLQGQMWYWILLGKTAILLLSLASLAVKYKRG